MKQQEKFSRLTRETWLQEALEVLADDPIHLRIDTLAQRLGVSKGSFYWHFENRSDFVHALAEHWRDTNTQAVVDAIGEVSGPPEERLRTLMQYIVAGQAARYDLAVRAWARIEPGILPIVREVDQIRLDTLRGLFEDLGFEEPELGIRTRAFVVFHSFESAFTHEMSSEEILRQLDARFAFFAGE